MKREIIITMITILLIIIGDIVTQNNTKLSVRETSESLKELKQKILINKEDYNSMKTYSDEIYKKWKNNTNGLAYYIEHDELEKVDVQMQLIIANLESETVEDTIPEIEQAIYLLQHIEDKKALKLKNIF